MMYWSPSQITWMVYLVVLAMGLIYLFRTSKPRSDTRLIAHFLFFYGAFLATVMLTYAFTGVRLIGSEGFLLLPNMLVGVLLLMAATLVTGVRLVHYIGMEFWPRLARWATGLFTITGLWIAVAMRFEVSTLGMGRTQNVLVWFGMSILWIFVVITAKAVALRRRGDRRERSMVYMTFAAFFSFVLFERGSSVSVAAFLPPEYAEAIAITGRLAVTGLLFLAALLFGQEQHRLQAKMLGFLLVTYVLLFSFTVPALRSEVDLLVDFQGPPDQTSLVIEPLGGGGYTLRPAEPDWVVPSGALQRVNDDIMKQEPLQFDFPFYGSHWDSVWVGDNGVLSFGSRVDDGNGWKLGAKMEAPIPTISPLYTDMGSFNPAAGFVFDHVDSSVVVTWQSMSKYSMPGLVLNVQAVLHQDGAIQFNYGDAKTWPELHIRGISPGGPYESREFGGDELQAAGAEPLLERTDNTQAYLAFLTAESVSLRWVGFGGILIVGLLGLAFYRVGLVVPITRVLRGLEEVRDGRLDVEVSVPERNELGAMADHFNEMTISLRTYSERMEELVDERTAELRATQAQLIEQEKLASLGSLTAGIAHEIKNPLNFVNNFAEVNAELADELSEAIGKGDAEEATALLADLRDNATQIAKHGKRADSIVRSMMQHARGGASERETIDVNDFVGEYADLAWHGMRARDDGFRAEIVRQLDPDARTLSVLPQELGRVLLNLLNNAFDAVRQTEGAEVRISTERLQGDVRITVSDNGPGIPPEIREKIFEPFFTTKPTGEGTGLGLSLSYDIVTKAHGGTMTVGESEEGGAAFTINLPA